MKKSRIFWTAYFSVCMAMMLSLSASAYIDPASTSYVIQVIAGIFIACGATVAVFWRKISFWFKKKKVERLKKQRDQNAGK